MLLSSLASEETQLEFNIFYFKKFTPSRYSDQVFMPFYNRVRHQVIVSILIGTVVHTKAKDDHILCLVVHSTFYQI
jgi:hypothetical protein